MSYKDELSDLDRDGERSLTQQLVDAIAAAIERGELGPGEKLPPTRELAELAGINHLTAVRAYRRLRELGLVSAHVGRGTFVRRAAAPARLDRLAALRAPGVEPGLRRSRPRRHAPPRDQRGADPAVGRLPRRVFPVEEISEAVDATLRSEPERALQYSDVQGLPDLAEQIASLSATRGAAEDPNDIVITNGAAQGLTLAWRDPAPG